MKSILPALLLAGLTLSACSADTPASPEALTAHSVSSEPVSFSGHLPSSQTETSEQRRAISRAMGDATLALISQTKNVRDWREAQQVADELVQSHQNDPQAAVVRVAAASFMLNRYLLEGPAADSQKPVIASHVRTLLTDATADLSLLAPALMQLDGYLPPAELRAQVAQALASPQAVGQTESSRARGGIDPSASLRADLEALQARL